MLQRSKRFFGVPLLTDYGEKLSEAQRLNGIEAVGSMSPICGTYRVYANGQWSEWKSGMLYEFDFPGFKAMGVVKRGGQWRFTSKRGARFQPLECSQIPTS